MMEVSELDFLSAIYYFTNYETKDYRKVLELAQNESIDINEKRRLSWVWPSIENLKQLQTALKNFKIRVILSIGCGSGLFEWIIRESIGVSIYGLERDRNWWLSHHAIKSFIKQNYIDDLKPNCLPETFMQRCCDIHDKKNWKFAIMFCYFNNRKAFLSYLEMYKGQWVIIVGPLPNVDIHTDPSPLDPHFPTETQWELCEQLRVGVSNMIAIYKNRNFEIDNVNEKENRVNLRS